MSRDTESAGRVSRELSTALILSGFTAVVAQVVLVREVLAVVDSNELSIGIAMALWLLWTAIGSGVLGHFGRGLSGRSLTSLLLVAESPALFTSLFLIHSIRHWWNAVPGESLAPLQTILTTAAALAVFCPIAGWLFTAGARAYAEEGECSSDESGSTMYLLEAAGSALGGVFASVVFFRLFDSLQIAALLSAINLFIATRLIFKKRTSAVLSSAIIGLAICGIALLPRAQLRLVESAWPGFQVVAKVNSRYGNLTTVKSEGNRSIVQNGLILFTAPDPPAAEEAVHFPLLEHPAPSSILMIGGGLNGSIAQVLHHPTVTRVDYVELDPAVLKIAERSLPQAWSKIAFDPRVHVHSEDGRLFIKSSARRFDVIIVNLPEPRTAQLNRFYTIEFFSEAAARLNTGGILALHLRGAEEYISPGLAEFLSSVNHTLGRVFPQVIAIPGEDVHLLASQNATYLAADPELLLGRLRERQIQTSYVREYYLRARMARDRIAELREQLASGEGRINRDFEPSGYYFSVALWGAQFSNMYRDLFRSAAQIHFSSVLWATIVATGVLLLLFGVRREPQHRAGNSARFAVAVSGLVVMGNEIIVLLGFEAIYGYVFDEIAIIVAGFMTGMALGSWRAIGSRQTLSRGVVLLITQSALTVLPLVLVGLLWIANGAHGLWMTTFIAHVGVPLFATACGFLGGYQFPIALTISRGTPHATGKLYGLDLLGAAVGAVALSTYVLPVFGFFNASLLISVPSVGALVLICMSGVLSGSLSARDPKIPAQ